MCHGSAYHDLRIPERVQACRRKVAWRNVAIPECEDCKPVQLCDTDKRAIGDAVAMY